MGQMGATAVWTDDLRLDVPVLREMFRNMAAFRALFESDGIDIVVSEDGSIEMCLWDLEYLIEAGLPMLAARQQEAIRLVLIAQMLEPDAARAMGISETTPVAVYAANGLRKLLVLVEQGRLPRFKLGDHE